MNASESVASILTASQYYAPINDLTKTYKSFLTISNGTYTQVEVALYVECYYRFQHLKIQFSEIRGITRLGLSSLGLIGYILEIFTLRHKDFRTVSFVYHKAIVFFEIITCLSMLFKGMSDAIPLPEQSLVFFIISSFIFDMLYNIAAFTADFITLFMTFERCVAVILPTKFYLVNQSNVAWTNVGISAFLGLSYIVNKVGATFSDSMTLGPSVSFSTRKDPIYISFTNVRDVINTWKGVLIGIFSVIVVFGIIKFSRNNKSVSTEKNWRKQQRIAKQLCILSLACGWPITLASLGLLVKNFYADAYIVGTSSFYLPFNEALELCNRGDFFTIEQYVYEVIRLIAHCLHFYLYFALSLNFRNATKDMMLRRNHLNFGWKKNQVTATTV